MAQIRLREGARGKEVKHVRSLLARIGLEASDTEEDVFGPELKKALTEFQERHLLPPSGELDAETFRALIEASWKLGERMLYLRRPPFRGNDVAELQSSLNALGFDAGRADGIFGPSTDGALREFQRHMGLLVDGIVGPATLSCLRRVLPRFAPGPGIAALKEDLQAKTGLVYLAEVNGPTQLVPALARELHKSAVAAYHSVSRETGSQIKEANKLGASLALQVSPRAGDARIHYYRSEHYESRAGRRMASLLLGALKDRLSEQVELRGSSGRFLRETRSPACVVELPPSAASSLNWPELPSLIAQAIKTWLAG